MDWTANPTPYPYEKGGVYYGPHEYDSRRHYRARRRYGVVCSYDWRCSRGLWRVWDSQTKSAVGPVDNYGVATDAAALLNREWREAGCPAS